MKTQVKSSNVKQHSRMNKLFIKPSPVDDSERYFPKQLPIYMFRNKFWFRDERLGEYRNVVKPFENVPIDDIPNSILQNPNTPSNRAKLKNLMKEFLGNIE